MDDIVLRIPRKDRQRMEKGCTKCKDARLRRRYLIILNPAEGRSAADTARALKVNGSTVYRVAARFREGGEEGLIDGRVDNGDCKLTDAYLSTLWEVVSSSPLEHGWRRPTWTREMLVETMAEKTGIRIHVAVATLSVALQNIGVRRGRPKPTVESTWSNGRKRDAIAGDRGAG